MSTQQAILKQTAAGQGSSFGFKEGTLLGVRLLVVFVALLIAFVVSAVVINPGIPLSPEEASQSGPAMLLVSLVNTFAVSFVILRSRWSGLKLMAAVFVVYFGVQTFMSQIETLYFIGALKMPLDMVFRIMGSGFLRALIFAPLAVWLLGKFKGSPEPEEHPRLVMPLPEWLKRFAILAVAYVLVYFLFGYFVAYQWVEAREYYAGYFGNDLVLPLFQVLRGLMWAALALPIVKMMKGQVWETCLAIGLVFAVLLASGVIFPNPFMPAMVRQAHFFELSSSMLTYGVIAGWVWTRSAHTTRS